MRYLLMVLAVLPFQCCLAAESSLGEELAAESGQQIKKMDALGQKGRAGPVKQNILTCSGIQPSPSLAEVRSANEKAIKAVANRANVLAYEGTGLEYMKDILVDIAKQAATSRLEATRGGEERKKTCVMRLPG